MYNGLVKKASVAALLFLLLVLKTNFVFAQSASSSAIQTHVDYTLPFPGLLPDNPLYYLKAIRDNLLKFFISDPLAKSQFDLLEANKRIAAAQLLLNKGESDLAITTLGKSGNYFDDAIAQIQIAKKRNEDVNPTLSEMDLASKKHQEIISQMEKGKKGDTLLQLRFLRVRAQDFQNRVEIIKS